MLTQTVLPQLITASIPSPSNGVWHVGPFPLRGYALCIIVGIVAAIWIGEKRWQARGGSFGEIQDIAIWAVPFGLVGARLYHVATDWKKYFGDGGEAVEALYVWKGGLGVWGGVALGALGAYIGARRRGIRFLPLLDALAPGVLVAQALGRWGNWFNQELYGKPTDLPWGLKIDQQHFSTAYEASPDYQQALQANDGFPPDFATFHPTFLYECLWNLAAFALIIWLDRRFRLGYGRVMAVYVMAYTLGRGWIEYIRIDDVQLNDVLGLRFNVWTSIVLFALAAALYWWSLRRHPGREESVYVGSRDLEEVTGDPDLEEVPGDADVEEVGQRPSRDAAADPEPDLGPETGPDTDSGTETPE